MVVGCFLFLHEVEEGFADEVEWKLLELLLPLELLLAQLNPKACNKALSWVSGELLVVRSFSPEKIELAPAKKHKHCNVGDIFSLPADKRMVAFFMTMRAVAMVRTSWSGSIGGGIFEGSSFNGGEGIDGDAFWLWF